MAWIGPLVVGLIVLLLGWQGWTLYQARRSEGRSIPGGADGAPAAAAQGRSVFYFYSQSCAACRTMTPRIEALATRYRNVHKVDVQDELELARQFNVRATPTTVLVEDGVIDRVYLGSQSDARLSRWLAD